VAARPSGRNFCPRRCGEKSSGRGRRVGSGSASSEAGRVGGRRKTVAEAEEVVVVVVARREGVEVGKTKRGGGAVVDFVAVVVGRGREGAGLMAGCCGSAVSEGDGEGEGEGEDGGGGEEDIAITSSCLVVVVGGNSPPRIGPSWPVSVSIERRRRFRLRLLAPNPSSA